MSLGLTHNGAIARGLAYAPTPAARSWAEPADQRFTVSAIKPVAPAANTAETDIPLAVVIWALWTSLWLAVAYVGGRYLPDGRSAPEGF